MKKLIYIACLLAPFLFYSCTSTVADHSTSKTSYQLTAPGEVGMMPDSLALIKEHIQWAVDNEYIAGGVALIARNNKIVYHEAVGFSDREKMKPLNTDHIFRMASMTKTITTLAAMQLYDQGKLNVSDPVSKYLPEFNNVQVVENFNPDDASYSTHTAEKELTIHHLLTHTAGIPYYTGHPVAGPIYSPLGIVEGWTKDSVLLKDNIAKMGKAPLVHEPGAQFTYGMSTDILGRIVEVASGMPLDEYFQQNIFAPLRMKDTYFYLPDSQHDRLVDVWFTKDFDLSIYPESLWEDYPINGSKTYFSGGGGLNSTALDYFKFANIFLNKGLFEGQKLAEEETVDLMMTNQIGELNRPNGTKFGYGGSVHARDGAFGIKSGRFGWAGYFQTTYWVDPARNIVAIMLTNARNTPKWGDIFNRYEEIVNNSVVE